MIVPPLPLSTDLLERYRLASRRKLRPDLLGGHQMRRKGQSLEFREFEHYRLGEDIRHVDWRASARYGGPNDLLMRSFLADEQFTLVISLDTRATMRLPEDLPKLQIAAWLAEAIARVALREGDRVILHRLFGRGAQTVTQLRCEAAGAGLRGALAKLCSDDGEDAANLKILRQIMPPAAVWLVLTDLYFEAEPQGKELARALINAVDGLRWVMLLDLDSWPAERERLGLGSRQLEGPGLAVEHPQYDIDEPALSAVAARILDHKRAFLQRARAGRIDHLTWSWPSDAIDPADFFRTRFLGDTVLQRLFMRDKA
jgi:uncharacterized protein (DUF58 family)